ncbi:unnamed protein product [Camellia sinensis]
MPKLGFQTRRSHSEPCQNPTITTDNLKKNLEIFETCFQNRKKAGKLPREEEEEESTHITESFDGESDNEKSEETVENLIGTSKYVPISKPRGRKRK